MKRLSLNDIQLGPMLGAGTVGEVFSGRIKQSGEEVAVKLLLLSLSQDELVRSRFQREMIILEKLQHPNIIRYFGGGNHEGRLFYAMEAVTGGTVKQLLERFGTLSWREVASIARQVCSALQHAHNHGIIHRDLKPGNLFLDPQGQIKLGDFGIARDTHSADLTHQGLTVGTHAYMSPEQIVGSGNISGKADLYSLGCVLFELLTGRKPFQGSNFAVLFEQHLRTPPPKATDFVAACPPALSDIIDQLLAKRPEDRPFNARAVQGVMMELLAQEDDPSAAPVATAVNSSIDSKQARKPRVNPETKRPTGLKKDVGAAAVVDPGMASLARKLHNTQERAVSWRALAIIGLAAIVLIVVAVFASR